MISALKKKFILSGMIATVILLFFLLTGITVSGFVRLERQDNAFLSVISTQTEEETPPDIRKDNPRVLVETPESDRFRRSFYTVEIDANGEIGEITAQGIWNEDEEEAHALAEKALATGEQQGRLQEQYKFLFKDSETGKILILLDVYDEIRSLRDTLCTAALFSLGCLLAMFVILLPVSDRMAKAYAQGIEHQKQFITNASHELKTPLAIILSNLDAMELINGENKWSRNIRGQASRLNTLLQRLLFMAKMDENSFRLKRETIDCTQLLRDEWDTYTETFTEKSVRCDFSAPDALFIHGNRDYLCQMLHVLLDNAAQYVPENGFVHVKLFRHKRRTVLTVENSVDALPDCPPEQLFERFWRGDSAHSQSGGHGIGLSAAQAVCEMHGGTLRCAYGENSIRFLAEIKA